MRGVYHRCNGVHKQAGGEACVSFLGRAKDPNTVQYRTYEVIENQYDVILNDDGKGEAADLVGLKVLKDEILLGLVHCKYSGGESPGKRIDDLYVFAFFLDSRHRFHRKRPD